MPIASDFQLLEFVICYTKVHKTSSRLMHSMISLGSLGGTQAAKYATNQWLCVGVGTSFARPVTGTGVLHFPLAGLVNRSTRYTVTQFARIKRFAGNNILKYSTHLFKLQVIICLTRPTEPVRTVGHEGTCWSAESSATANLVDGWNDLLRQAQADGPAICCKCPPIERIPGVVRPKFCPFCGAPAVGFQPALTGGDDWHMAGKAA